MHYLGSSFEFQEPQSELGLEAKKIKATVRIVSLCSTSLMLTQLN